MIQLPTKTEIEALQKHHGPNSLTIYIPYIARNASDNPNRIQLKDSLKNARQLLAANGLDQRKIDAMLRPAEELLGKNEFRPNYRHSLAFFISRNFFKYFRLPTNGITASIAINNKFDVMPILHILKDNFPYYILILSHSGVQLLKGDRYNIKRLKFQNFPTTLKKELSIDEYPNARQAHTVSTSITSRGYEAVHGQYDKRATDKILLQEFFRRIDHKLHAVFKNEKTPLILSGTDYLLPIYRQINTYPHLSDDELKGNPKRSAFNFLRKAAFDMLANGQ